MFLVLILLLIFVFNKGKENSPNTFYHESRWNEYVTEIDLALSTESISSKPEKAEPIKLSQIYGGVVSHHIPTTIPKLVEFYSRLAKTKSIKNFIIIGPDHTDSGQAPITVSNASFRTKYGELEPIKNLATELQYRGLANVEESVFDPEHSVGSQILLISKFFPEARVTPIIVRSDTTSEQAKAIGKYLSNVQDNETMIILSVDFSHYLSSEQAMSLDTISGNVLKNLDSESIALVKADSLRSVQIYIEAMKGVKASDVAGFSILNTNDFMQNSDYTTGYVFGYWGVK